MMKRTLPQLQGQHKKARLDVTFSDHNFPLSQNVSARRANNDLWGDENDDEMLLLASQACEEVYTSNDISTLPDYSICMKPASTSTQIFKPPLPCSSRNPSKYNYSPSPSSTLQQSVYIHSSNIPNSNNDVNVTDDFAMKDKIYKEQDTEHIYRKLLQSQEENAKLKSENGKLLEKCVTKDGEVSILRTQLKTCQVTMDSARLEQVKAQEKVKSEFTDKILAYKNEIQDLRAQLGFKNLEIMGVKERCKLLESSKVKLTQVNISAQDFNISQRNYIQKTNHHLNNNETASTSVQTDNKEQFVKLNKRSNSSDEQTLQNILPFLLQQTTEKQNLLSDYNEKLHKSKSFSQARCQIFSTFHRIPSTPTPTKKLEKVKLSLRPIFEDLSCITSANNKNLEHTKTKYIRVFSHIKEVLSQVLFELECISQRITPAFLREMDEIYMEATEQCLDISAEMLLYGKALYKDEQALLERRAATLLSFVISSRNSSQLFFKWEQDVRQTSGDTDCMNNMMELFCKICKLIDHNSCAVPYSSLLMALTYILENIWKYIKTPVLYTYIMDILKYIITSRTMPDVVCRVLSLLKTLTVYKSVLDQNICHNIPKGNLKFDYEQGVMLYKKDSCIMQVFLKQIEVALKAMEKLLVIKQLISTTQNLLGLYSNINSQSSNYFQDNQTSRCVCASTMKQVLVYSLHICASVLKGLPSVHDHRGELEAICRSGLIVLYQWMLQDIEFSTRFDFNEGHYQLFVENCEQMKESIILDDIHATTLMDLVGTLQVHYEDVNVSSECQQIWADSFDKFTITD